MEIVIWSNSTSIGNMITELRDVKSENEKTLDLVSVTFWSLKGLAKWTKGRAGWSMMMRMD
jgi:hypothetical protein